MILWNDQLVKEGNNLVSVRDRGYNFGDGVYEVFRLYKGQLFEVEDHYTRLLRSAEGIRISLPFTIPQLHERLLKLVRASEVKDGTLYMQITRGEAPRAHPFPQHTTPVLTAWCSESKRNSVMQASGISAVTLDDIRWHRCDMKTLNLLPNVLAKQEAIESGADEAILHRDGTVTECSASNIMIVQAGTVITHPADNHILHGVTRAIVLKLARQTNIVVHERPFTVDELLEADEVFITGTTVEITPVVRINDRPVGHDGTPGVVTTQLQRAFAAYAGL